PDHDVGDTGDRNDVARPGFLRGLAVQRLGQEQFGDFDVLDAAVGADPGDLLAFADLSLVDAAQGEPAQERGRVQVRDVGLEGCARGVGGGGNRVEDGGEQRFQSVAVGEAAVGGAGEGGPAFAGARVDDGEVDLLLGGVQVEEELVGVVHHLGDPAV